MESHPPLARVESLPPPARVKSHPPQVQVERHPPPCQSSKLASTSGGEKPATSGGPVNPPPGREGVGDGASTDWYQRILCRAEGGISEPQGPPYPIGMVQARREAISQIYNCMDGKDLPPSNVASKALRAYYSGVDPKH